MQRVQSCHRHHFRSLLQTAPIFRPHCGQLHAPSLPHQMPDHFLQMQGFPHGRMFQHLRRCHFRLAKTVFGKCAVTINGKTAAAAAVAVTRTVAHHVVVAGIGHGGCPHALIVGRLEADAAAVLGKQIVRAIRAE